MSKADEADMDRLAELVADGATVAGAGKRLGLSALRREVLWTRIVATLGAQAC